MGGLFGDDDGGGGGYMPTAGKKRAIAKSDLFGGEIDLMDVRKV